MSFEKEHVLTKKKFFCSWFTGNKKTTMWSRSTARSFSEYGAFCRLYFYLLRLNKYSIDLRICFKLEKTPYSHVFSHSRKLQNKHTNTSSGLCWVDRVSLNSKILYKIMKVNSHPEKSNWELKIINAKILFPWAWREEYHLRYLTLVEESWMWKIEAIPKSTKLVLWRKNMMIYKRYCFKVNFPSWMVLFHFIKDGIWRWR